MGLVAAVLVGLVTALALSVLRDDGAPEPVALTLPSGDGTAPHVDLTGQTAPAFALEGLDEPPTTLDEVRDGRPAVINFFASWCAPCVREMPGIEALHQELGDRVQFMGVSEDLTDDDARALVAETGVTYPIGRDRSGDILAAYQGIGMPTTVLVSADGTITSSYTRRVDEAELEQAIRDELLPQ